MSNNLPPPEIPSQDETPDYPYIVVRGVLQQAMPLHEFLVEQSTKIFVEHPFFAGGKIEIIHNPDGPPPFTNPEDWNYLLNVTLVTADGRRFFLWNFVGSNDYVLQDASLFE